VVAVLQRILKQFAISSKQLQGNPASTHTRSTCGRFDEYFPVIEVLLDLLERAVEGHIIEVCPETGQLVQNQLFEGMSFSILSTFSASDVFLRYQQANSSAIKGSFKAGMGEATPLLQTSHTYCLSRRRHYESFQEIHTPRNTMATASATAR
jgi:hypothetical protein